MSGHDPLCQTRTDHYPSWCDCPRVHAIRADERAKAHVHNTGTSSPDACCECCYDVPSLERDHLAARRRVKELVDERDDLRAKVKRIPKVDQTWAGSELILRADVLALLGDEATPCSDDELPLGERRIKES